MGNRSAVPWLALVAAATSPMAKAFAGPLSGRWISVGPCVRGLSQRPTVLPLPPARPPPPPPPPPSLRSSLGGGDDGESRLARRQRGSMSHGEAGTAPGGAGDDEAPEGAGELAEPASHHFFSNTMSEAQGSNKHDAAKDSPKKKDRANLLGYVSRDYIFCTLHQWRKDLPDSGCG